MGFRDLPSVDVLVSRSLVRMPRPRLVVLAREVLAVARARIQQGLEPGDLDQALADRVRAAATPLLCEVINATGVILHTNLGRAPLPDFRALFGYSNLEFDLETGGRGKRDSHFRPLLEELLGHPAIAVNNNAAATYLALHELAAGGEVIVSRGELVEIGDGFRIPEIMQRSGAILREVGATNKTRVQDYAQAIGERTRLILRVHPSNFRMVGFTGKPEVSELAALARERGIPLYEDIGSGCLINLKGLGIDEPVVQESLAAGADLVTFSVDKLMGGPQAGILAGRADLVERLRRNPMYRAFRLDKLQVQALETVVRLLVNQDLDAIPAIRMMLTPADEVRRRAEALELPGWTVEPGESVIGGGSTPGESLPTWVLKRRAGTEALARLRTNQPPVIARLADDHVVVDLRTVLPGQEAALSEALRKV
jgi:L-seryl-tRNA(Ser) seleniumtransferase